MNEKKKSLSDQNVDVEGARARPSTGPLKEKCAFDAFHAFIIKPIYLCGPLIVTKMWA